MMQTNATPASGTRARILVVDDDDDSRIITRLVLEHIGYQVSEARDGPEGLRIALDERPEMVLMDIALPGLDGWEVSRRMRASQATCRTRIIAITALTGSDLEARSLSAGCDALLMKPVYIETLAATIRRELGSASLASLPAFEIPECRLNAFADR